MPSDQSVSPGVTIERVETRMLMAGVPAGFVAEPWGGRIDEISSLAFAPDGRMFAITQPGGVYITGTNGSLLPGPALQLDVAHEAEQGLSGIAFDPNFKTDPWLYLYYTRPVNTTTFVNEIARFRVSGNSIDASSKQVLMALDPVYDAIHNAGALAFGADGKLYVAVGDGAVATNAQSLTNRQGKVLRLNKDGSIPADNPTRFVVRQGGGQPTTVSTSGVYRSIYAVGLRNPFSLDFDKATGQLIVGDVGQEDWEELNVIKPGANYGWSTSGDGDFNPAAYPEFTRPLYAFAHGTTLTTGNAVVGVSSYTGLPAGAAGRFPAAYDGRVFFGEYDGDGWINYIDPAAPPAASGATVFATGFAGMTDMEVGPDGALYVVQRWTNNPGVTRIRPNTAVAPAIVQQPQNQTAAVGQSAVFSVGVTGQAPFTYQWYRNGGAIGGAKGATYTLAAATLADSGASFHVTVTNGLGQVQSVAAKLTVTADNAPVPTIIAPAATVLASGGVRIDLLGSATDAEDGVLPGTSLTWKVDYYTGGLQRPFVSAFTGAGGSFTPHAVTPYLDVDVFYRVSLTATDSAGRSTTVTRDVQPLVVTVALATTPQGLPLVLGGTQVMSTYSFKGVAGVNRELEAPQTFALNGQTYVFTGWSNGGPRVQTLATPAVSSTITANYAAVPPAPLKVESITIDTASASWRATVKFSGDVLASIDVYDFGLSSPDNSWIALPDRPIVLDTAANTATIEIASSPLPAGTYTFSIYPDGVTDPMGAPLTAGASTTFTSGASPAIVTATLGGRVFNDVNNDGIAQASEAGLAGVQVWIDANANGLLDAGETATVTTATGGYQFANLPAGTYAVRATAPAGYAPGTVATTVVIASGQTTAAAPALGFYAPPVTPPSTPVGTAKLAGIVFDDKDRDGWRDAGENGRAAVTMYLDKNNNGTLDAGEASTTTDAGGYYEFRNLTTGTYNVRAVRGTLVQTTPTANAAVVTTVTAAGQSVFVKDLGLAAAVAPPLPKPTSLTATAAAVYHVRLNWLSDATNVTAFVIERRTGTGAWALISDTVARTVRTFSDYTVKRGVTYTYRVRAKGAAGSGDPSNEVTVKSL